ncbi:hypothetical protein PQX77_009393 [Marasmius sp. AFHP31]|nr:hypothetical protein PQX77_009393 [Marasmius sp. AFHP31]
MARITLIRERPLQRQNPIPLVGRASARFLGLINLGATTYYFIFSIQPSSQLFACAPSSHLIVKESSRVTIRHTYLNAAIGNLWDAIAGVGASHTAEQQFSRGKCFEGTRVRVIAMIHDWRSAKHQPLPICWLSGPAGVSKTAIAVTIAKSAEDNGLVNSFFFRSDPRRNNPSALVPSIAHGLTVSKTSLKVAIEKRIAGNPTILEARLEEQFWELVVKPCTSKRWQDRIRQKWEAIIIGIRITPTDSNKPAVVIIDGLDECGDDRSQLRVLSAIVSSYQQFPSFPLRFLICSWPESWIKDAFRRTPLSRFTKHILKCVNVLSALALSSQLPGHRRQTLNIWKLSGQFIYAITAAKFIGLPCSDPIKQLHYILCYDPETHTCESSFSELDRPCHIALSISPNHPKLRSVLAAIFVLRPRATPSPEFIELPLDLPAGDVDLTLRYMHSVLSIQGGDVAITAYHASLTDFIYDQSRSRESYVNRSVYGHAFAIQWLGTFTQKVKTTPDIILCPGSISTVQSKLFKGWFNFCLTGTQAIMELLIERDNLLRAILRAFPDRQRFVATLPSLILLPVYGPGWVPF